MSTKATIKVIKDIDPAKFDALRSRLMAKADQVNVGFPGGIPSSDGGPLTVAQIATVHEFGSPAQGIPERSFLRAGIAENRAKYRAVNADSIKKILRGERDMVQALGLLGEVAKGDVQQKITDGPFAALSPRTIKQKGSSKPLIDSGQMRQSVAWEIPSDTDR